MSSKLREQLPGTPHCSITIGVGEFLGQSSCGLKKADCSVEPETARLAQF